MQNTFSKQALVAALKATFIGNNQKLKQTTDYLATASKQTGFCMSMMEIVDDQTQTLDVKQAALIQLKNNVKMRWSAKKEEIEITEKDQIKGALLVAVIRCNRTHKLIKLYKEIFTIIIGYDYKTWFPVMPIMDRLKQQQDMVPLMHVLLAISASFQFSITEQQRNYFFQFLKAALPVCHDLVTRLNDPEIIYLGIKFLWKAIHYQINQEIKMLACNWMEILHTVVSAKNPTYDNQHDQIQNKNTPQFFYFHSKKWATRVLLRFFQKHAKRVTYHKNQDNRPFADHWYNTYAGHLINAIIGQFAIGTIKKVRYFQLKCLHTLIGQRPELVKQYAQVFQYDILLAYLRLQPQDQQLAQSQPIQFLSKQQQPSINFTNLKRVATDVWVSFAQMGCKIQKKGQPYEPGVFFFQNMNYLQTKMSTGTPVEKELAMYLICQLRMPITRCKQVKKILPSLISTYVIPEFNNEIMFLRARAVDIFTQFGSIQIDDQVIRQSVEGIYNCLTKDPSALVRIKAASAFNCILKHKAAKDLVRPLLKDILTVYLQLLQKYDLQNIINSLQSIVQDFATQISPFAYELTKHLIKLFFKLFGKDMEQSNQQQYDGQAQLAAAGCLKTITRIIQSPIPHQTIVQIQPQIISLLQFIFTQEGVDYIQDSLILLNAYLFRLPKLSGQLWFFLQIVVYNMVGIPKDMWAVIDKTPMSQKQRQIMHNMKSAQNSEMMEQSMLVLRNYIKKISELGQDGPQQAIKANMVSLMLFLNAEIYKKGPNQFSGELDITCCTALFVYLLENFQRNLPETVYTYVWEYCKINIAKFKSKMLKIINSQLLGLLVWICPTHVLSLAHKDNLLPVLLRQLVSYQSKYQQYHQRARVILGLNALLALQQKPPGIMQKMPDIFKVNLKLIKKNAQQRVDGSDLDQNEDFQEEQQPQDLQFESDDEQDFWQEQYGNNYSSCMDSIDQIADFKRVMEHLRNNQGHFYQEIVKVVSAQDLIQVDEKVTQALEKVEILSGLQSETK